MEGGGEYNFIAVFTIDTLSEVNILDFLFKKKGAKFK